MSSSKETKVALVTGSSSGIGAATVKLFAQKGYNVVVCGYEPELVKQVADECTELSPENFKPLALVSDFGTEDSEIVVTRTIEHFGRLDVLVNNAGIFVETDGQNPSSYDAYRRVMAINLDAAIRVSLAAVKHLKSTNGSMIFVSSVVAFRPPRRWYAYTTSKAAVTAFAKSLAIDVSPHVRVNIVSPGAIITPIYEKLGLSQDETTDLLSSTTLQQRMGQPEEIAQAVYFLASDNSSFINGVDLVVDGGLLMKPVQLGAKIAGFWEDS